MRSPKPAASSSIVHFRARSTSLAARRVFLHNLCTNDVRNLPVLSWCEAFFTTATAKVVAYVKIACLTEDAAGTVLRIETAPEATQRILKHLDHYLISEQVEFLDRTAELSQLHIAGPEAARILGQVLKDSATVPALSRLIIADIRGIPVQIRRNDELGVSGYDVLFPAAHSEEVLQDLASAGAALAGPDVYDILRIEACTPSAEIDVDETTFAPEVGRQLQAISYAKGCYLGQEPIVMARDRGQVNRKLVGLKLSGEPVPPGSLVFLDGKEIGRVTSSVKSPSLGTIALAYVRRGHQDPGTKVEIEANGRQQATIR